jgi:transposase-like protein
MSDTIVEQRPANPKAEQWAERIAAQGRSGTSVKQFCKEQGLTEYSFYAWRRRLQETGPVRGRYPLDPVDEAVVEQHRVLKVGIVIDGQREILPPIRLGMEHAGSRAGGLIRFASG